MTTFAQADSNYRIAIEAVGRELPAAFATSLALPTPDLNKDELTEAALLRMKSFLVGQDMIKDALAKAYAAPAADFFVETIIFFLRVALAQSGVQVASERNAVRRAGSLRPDVSIWRQDTLLAAVECKTQLGWNRDGWLEEFEGRESRLKVDCPDSKLFLLVMSGGNWPGFGEDSRVGKQFFVLLEEIWPRDMPEYNRSYVRHRIEQLVSEILAHIEALPNHRNRPF